ncbi:hypothetical protein [Nonomuraea angiospora]|uniref:hypothetical protein n=1 Tax=Nonomuraea angiospora TaxID=46172 RepID=UPI0029AD9B0A|nr:hypothetical protein [Nonomuraea angiospora]MDX3099682.1 hypothetical protein [Nonomuraea angiospora]
MGSRHELTTSTFRPERDELIDAGAHLPQGKTMDGFLRACLRTLRDDPQALLELIGPRWPADKPRGRPPKKATP